MEILLNILFMIIGLGLLIKGSDIFVDAGTNIGKIFKMSEVLIGLTIVCVGTGLPELILSINGAINNTSNLVENARLVWYNCPIKNKEIVFMAWYWWVIIGFVALFVFGKLCEERPGFRNVLCCLITLAYPIMAIINIDSEGFGFVGWTILGCVAFAYSSFIKSKSIFEI